MVVRILRALGLGVLGLVALALIALALIALALIAALVFFLLGSQKLSRVHPQAGEPLTVALNVQSLARGEHLVRSVTGCADCHGGNLGGTVFLEEAGFATIYAPNLTRGEGGAASRYSEAD